jgi:predicted nucleotidyltransferase
MSGLVKSLECAQVLQSENCPCILIGGFAVNEHGYTRNTLDIDFMIQDSALTHVKDVMRAHGFTCITQHENVTFFSMPEDPFRVDFLVADVSTFRKLLENAEKRNIMGTPVTIPALKDLLAMKIFALTGNVRKRMGKDLPDIAFLTVLNKLDVERDLLPLCGRFGNSETTKMILEYIKDLRS